MAPEEQITNIENGQNGEHGENTSDDENKRCSCLSLDKNPQARGANFNGFARGSLNMSNVYLANSFILLACKEAGGANEAGTVCINPTVEIYGLKPASFISNIAVAASILAAFIMPPLGAVVDFTPHRKSVGIVMSVLLAVISGIQIGTVDATWFPMVILQALIYCIYQLQLTALYAYFPEIAREVGQKKMNMYSSTWSFNQFISQAVVNAFTIALTIGFKLGTVHTAMVSQVFAMVFSAVFLGWCWKLLPSPDRKHTLPKGHSLFIAGFKQNCYMAKKIWNNYKTGLRWFLLSRVFAEAAASAVATTAVVFLSLELKLNAFQIGMFFEVSLFGVIFGTKLGMLVTSYINPKRSLALCEVGFGLSVVIGAWAVQYAPHKELTYIWGFSIGIFLGWFYPCENVFFGMCVPINVETELAGFFNYCSQIMGWLPPLVFSIVVEANVRLPWALTVVAAHFLPSIFLLSMCGPWDEIVAESKTIEVDFNYARHLEQQASSGNEAAVEKVADDKEVAC